jgi:hypothetical protein
MTCQVDNTNITTEVARCCFTCNHRLLSGPKNMYKCMLSGNYNSKYAVCSNYALTDRKPLIRSVLDESQDSQRYRERHRRRT